MINDSNTQNKSPDRHLPRSSEQLKELQGAVTGIYADRFDINWEVHDDSKLWFITDVGPDRDEYLNWLRQHQIEVLEPKSSFGWIKIVIPDQTTMEILQERFGHNLSLDG